MVRHQHPRTAVRALRHMAGMTREYRACQARHGLEIVTAARQEQLNVLSPELSTAANIVSSIRPAGERASTRLPRSRGCKAPPPCAPAAPRCRVDRPWTASAGRAGSRSAYRPPARSPASHRAGRAVRPTTPAPRTPCCPRYSERRLFRFQARHLLNCARSHVADKHLIILRYFHAEQCHTPPPSHGDIGLLTEKGGHSGSPNASHDPGSCDTLPHSDLHQFSETHQRVDRPESHAQGTVKRDHCFLCLAFVIRPTSRRVIQHLPSHI